MDEETNASRGAADPHWFLLRGALLRARPVSSVFLGPHYRITVHSNVLT